MKKLIILITLVMMILAITGCEVTDNTEIESTITFEEMEKVSEIRTN